MWGESITEEGWGRAAGEDRKGGKRDGGHEPSHTAGGHSSLSQGFPSQLSSSTDPCHSPSRTPPQSSLFERALLTSTDEDTNLERREEKGKKSKRVFKTGLTFLSGSSLWGQLQHRLPQPTPTPPHDLAGTLRGIKEQLRSWVLGLETRMFSEKPWGGKEK